MRDRYGRWMEGRKRVVPGEICAERKGYVRAHRSFNRIWKERDSAQPDLLEKILDRDNFNRAFKRVKANKGALGVNGMTIDETLQWLKEHNHELTDRMEHYAASIAYSRKGYWFLSGNKAVNRALSKERLIRWGFYDLSNAYQSAHVNFLIRPVFCS